MTEITAQHMSPEDWLEELSQAIAEEAEALVSADADALLLAVARKERAAEGLEGLSEEDAAKLDSNKVAGLREANLSNAALMQAAQAHACWSLQQLGRLDSASTYSGQGQTQSQTVPRYFGAA